MLSRRTDHRMKSAVVLAALSVLGAVARGDDVVVEEQAAAGAASPAAGFQMAMVDLGQVFDAQAFAEQMVTDQIGMVAARDGKHLEDELARRLDPVRRRAEARIATLDRIVGLSEQQHEKLALAAESDLRRLTTALAEAREKYAGRTLTMDPRNGGLDASGRKEMQQAQEDGQRCRQLVRAAGGPESLLAKVVVGILDEPQASRYAAVMQGRAACRWQAVVAAGLAQLDEQIGFTQKQHEAIAAFLLADPPPVEDEPQRQAVVPAGIEVARRLAAMDEATLATMLDPRQRQVVSVVTEQARIMGEGPVVLGGGMGGGMF